MTEIPNDGDTREAGPCRALLATHSLDAIVLGRVANFAWLTDGAASYVNTASTFGASSLVVTADEHSTC